MINLESKINSALNQGNVLGLSTGEKIAVLIALGAWQTNKLYGSDIIAALDRLEPELKKAVFDWYYSHEDGQPDEYYEKRDQLRAWANEWGRSED